MRRERETERIGPFLAGYSRTSGNPYLNYAIPDDGARPTPADVASLVDAFARRGLRARLEYLPAAAPLVQAALARAGLVPEGRLAVMALAPSGLVPAHVPEGFTLDAPMGEAAILSLLRAQHEAYDDAPPTDAQVAAARDRLGRGAIACLAVAEAGREPAGGGECPAPAAGLAEVAGIAVRAPFRRRGLGRAITAWLCQRAFDGGVRRLWLTPAGEAEERIYAAVGFGRVAEALHISIPA